MAEVFEKLGIRGMPDYSELALLASLLTGDPALLIGKQGTAKTAAVNALGAALREAGRRREDKEPVKYIAYDCSKLNFEDMLGMPNPKALQDGRMEFVSSEATIWDKHLVCFDEYNRQDPARQNNIFEIQRSRTIMGLKTAVTWVFNCMNPHGMAGTEVLDDALVDRNTWFVYLNDFTHLSTKAQDQIITHVGAHDAMALNRWGTGIDRHYDTDDAGEVNQRLAAAGEHIELVVKSAAGHYAKLLEEVGPAYATFVGRFVSSLTSVMENKDWKVELSGRRAGMIWRALLSFRAVDLAKCELSPRRSCMELKPLFKKVLQMTIPIGIAKAKATGQDRDALASIEANVDAFDEFFTSGGKLTSHIDAIYRLVTTKSIYEKLDLLLHHVKSEIAVNQVWSSILGNDEGNEATEQRNCILATLIAHLMTVKPNLVPQNIQSMVCKKAVGYGTLLEATNSITLKGYPASFKDEVEKLIADRKGSLSVLQAKLIIEDFCHQHEGEVVSKADFRRMLEECRGDCESLEILVQDQALEGTEESAAAEEYV